MFLALMAIVLIAAAVLPALHATTSEASYVGPSQYRELRAPALTVDVGCVVRNAGYAIDWIINSAPRWYKTSVIHSWRMLMATWSPYWGAAFVGLVSPWAYAIVRPCIR